MGKAENYVEDYLRQQSKKHDILCFKFVSPGTNGVPDDIIIAHGQTIFIETKSLTGKAAEIQKERIKQMKEHGAIVHICHTRTAIDHVLSQLVQPYISGQKKQKPKQKRIVKMNNTSDIPIIRKSIRTDK